MSKLNKLLIFILPVFIVCLLIVNGEISARIYGAAEPRLLQYDAEIASPVGRVQAKAGSRGYLELKIKNNGLMAWASGQSNGIAVSYHILDKDGNVLLFDGERTALTGSVATGDQIIVNMGYVVPEIPGSYFLEIDMVHEGVTWFAEKGSKTLRVELEVTE